MNKLFPLHPETTGQDTSRPYHINTWEPIAIDVTSNNFVPFQYSRLYNTSYFSCTQVIDTVETDITDLFFSGTELISTWTKSANCVLTYSGSDYTITEFSNTSDYPTETITSNTFSANPGKCINFRIDGNVSPYGDVYHVKLYKGSTVLLTAILHSNKNELSYKVSSSGSDYKIVITGVTAGPLDNNMSVTDAVWSCQTCGFDIHNDILTFYNIYMSGMVPRGICTFKFQTTGVYYSDVCLITLDSTWHAENIKITISSSVDYAGIYYKGGFIQTLYRLANVRRSPNPKITVTGEERNGIIVQEKIVTATRYTIKMKCTEEILDAMTTATGATITVTDQTGKVFTVNNMEISEPEWYGTNGIVSISFDDNINVFTQNQTDL